MPLAAPHACRPGCPALVPHGQRYCDAHGGKTSTAPARASAHERGYGSRWRARRAVFLARNPLCVGCRGEGRVEPATVVDHITPHRGDKKLFWDEKNWQALCASHHAKKTASEDGAFGNPVRR